MAFILIAEDSATQAGQVRGLLEDAGFSVRTAPNGAAALRILDDTQPDLILTDLDMPEVNGLQLVEASRRKYPHVPVVLMTAFGSEEIAIQALERGAASYVPKRNLARDLVETLEAVLSVAQAKRDQERLLEFLSETQTTFSIGNDVSLIMPVVRHAQSAMDEMRLGDKTERIRAGVALERACYYAIYSGNLELTTEELQEAYNLEDGGKAYFEMIESRRKQPPFQDRRVEVDVHMTRQQATFGVRHEGRGFDAHSILELANRADLDDDGQRGWLLITTFMDDVSFEDDGKHLVMVKHAESNHVPAAK